MRKAWDDGILFGVGSTVAVVGVCRIVLGPIPDDWTIVPMGIVIMGIAMWQRWSSWDRSERKVGP